MTDPINVSRLMTRRIALVSPNFLRISTNTSLCGYIEHFLTYAYLI